MLAARIGTKDCPFWYEIIVKPKDDIPDIPDASPSIPSSQFIAFVKPTIQKVVSLLCVVEGQNHFML